MTHGFGVAGRSGGHNRKSTAEHVVSRGRISKDRHRKHTRQPPRRGLRRRRGVWLTSDGKEELYSVPTSGSARPAERPYRRGIGRKWQDAEARPILV